jgi:glycosyltransferase involved in cell wall biosynthesis
MLSFNHAKFISQAIEGVLKQKTDFKFRLLIADDCSGDETPDIIKRYQQQYPDMITSFSNRKNIGPRLNFIKAYDVSHGAYIALCEGDDYWTDENKLQKQVDFLNKNSEFILTFHDITTVNDNGLVFDDGRLPRAAKKDYDVNGLLYQYLPTPTIVFRKIFKKAPGIFRKSDNGDSILQALLTQKGKAKYHTEIENAIIRVHSAGFWSSRALMERWGSTLKTKFLIFKELPDSVRKQSFKHFVTAFELASIDADKDSTRNCWFRFNFRYVQFCLVAGAYGKAWLIFRRILQKYSAA